MSEFGAETCGFGHGLDFCSSHCFIQQDPMSNRYDSIVQWLPMGNVLMVTCLLSYLLTHSYAPKYSDFITTKQICATLV